WLPEKARVTCTPGCEASNDFEMDVNASRSEAAASTTSSRCGGGSPARAVPANERQSSARAVRFMHLPCRAHTTADQINSSRFPPQRGPGRFRARLQGRAEGARWDAHAG